MELKIYFNLLLKWWWVVLSVFLVTLVATVIFTYTQIPVYEASTTYVVAPSALLGDVKNFTSGLSLLSREEAVAGTYAEVASSKSIKKQAIESLNTTEKVKDYDVSSRLLAGTNVFEIVVTGPDPALVQNLANAIGRETVAYVTDLYETYSLSRLDEATLPTKPVSPIVSRNLVLGAAFGLILGIGIAFLAESLLTSLPQTEVSVNIIDSETGVYNKEYFMQRLGKEMVRAKRNRYPLSLALMRIDNLALLKGSHSSRVRSELLRQVAIVATEYLREEDMIAYFKDDTFAFLLTDTTGENAKAIMEYLQTRVAWTPFQSEIDGIKFNLKGIVGVVIYHHNGTSRDEMLAYANKALKLAEVDGSEKTYLMDKNTSYNEEQNVVNSELHSQTV